MPRDSQTKASLVSVVIPVYNEEECLDELIRRCLESCRGMGRDFELLLIDDGSSDRSLEIIEAAAGSNPEIIGVVLNRNYGQHAAVIAGFEHARGEIIVTLDADLQNPPEEIPRLVAQADTGVDVVGSIRVERKDSLFRRASSALVNHAVRRATGVMMHDYGCMLRAYRRPVVEAMLKCHERSTFIPILANSFARTTAEVEVHHAPRAAGESKYSVWKLVNLQFDLLTGMTTFPLRLLTILGGLLSIAGVSFGVLLLSLRFYYGADWAGGGVFTLFAVLFTFIGAQFIAMGLLGEYVGRIYGDVRGRPRFFVERVLHTAPALERRERA